MHHGGTMEDLSNEELVDMVIAGCEEDPAFALEVLETLKEALAE